MGYLFGAVVALVTVSFLARTFLAERRCAELGLRYEFGHGCIDIRPTRPIIIERGLKRT